jgi:hypothetical protein
MADPHPTPTADRLGFRRIDSVRVVLGAGRPFAEVSGIARRFPRTVRTSLATANELAAAGLRVDVEVRTR